jgi:hypothetical protein
MARHGVTWSIRWRPAVWLFCRRRAIGAGGGARPQRGRPKLAKRTRELAVFNLALDGEPDALWAAARLFARQASRTSPAMIVR